MRHFLDFEKPIAELESKIEELRKMSEADGINIAEEVARLTAKADSQTRATYAKLTAWQKTQVARHPERPKAKQYIASLISDFTPLAGDRAFGEDAAIVGGLGRLGGRSVVVLGQEKGDDTDSRIRHNFGMARPEGYRKAMRLMELASKFSRPIVCFLDTPGAYPGIDAEERGQAEAIAQNLREMARLRVPVIVIVIGEGGSGGALALGVGNRVYMLENAVYSVISPESCASIIYRDAAKAPLAAASLKMSAPELKHLGLIDGIVPEPGEGAHTDHDSAAEHVRDTLRAALAELQSLSAEQLIEDRYQKFRRMGAFFEEAA